MYYRSRDKLSEAFNFLYFIKNHVFHLLQKSSGTDRDSSDAYCLYSRKKARWGSSCVPNRRSFIDQRLDLPMNDQVRNVKLLWAIPARPDKYMSSCAPSIAMRTASSVCSHARGLSNSGTTLASSVKDVIWALVIANIKLLALIAMGRAKELKRVLE